MNSSILFAGVFLILTACTSAQVQPSSNFASPGEVVCKDVAPVGSHLKKRVCTNSAATAQESKEAQDALADAQQRLRDDLMTERSRSAPRTP